MSIWQCDVDVEDDVDGGYYFNMTQVFFRIKHCTKQQQKRPNAERDEEVNKGANAHFFKTSIFSVPFFFFRFLPFFCCDLSLTLTQ